jgi:hypothetical protein
MAFPPKVDVIPALTAAAELKQPPQKVELEVPPSVEIAAVIETAEPPAEEVVVEPTQEIEPLSLEAIREFLGIEEAATAQEVDLDSFWDDALEETERGPLNSSGMSLDEARKQGLIPTEFDQPGKTGKGG